MITLKETINAIESEWITFESLEIYLVNYYKLVFYEIQLRSRSIILRKIK